MHFTPEILHIWASLWLASLLIWISVWDLKHLRIPDPANALLALSGLGLAAWRADGWPAAQMAGAAVGYILFAGIGALYFQRTGQDGLGLGDAKLLGAAGAWTGLAALPGLIAFAAISALVYALVTRCRRLAFGPWLSASLFLHWIFLT
ncbi:prepilin peptidase [Roseobacter sp. MH60115]|uniref:prepilin peptidase n=1 Tax=Roseobacter sp. MH60115 TaxID=2785324 RepID=UPI0018A2F55A|nr:A24 family peptidase [Roseobacter sp. MH60115]